MDDVSETENAIIDPPIPFGTRSDRKCFLVLVGETGTGKSSSINVLFDRCASDLLTCSEFKSDTNKIIEYKVARGTSDVSDDLIVIDTPGFRDTGGPETDAKIMATLEEYLSEHADLGKAYPSGVLLVMKFSDDNITKPNSFFINFLKYLDILMRNGTLIDSGAKTCNLTILLTHYMDVDDEIKKYPHDRVTLIQGLIKTFTRIPISVKFVFAENQGRLFNLHEENGYFKLPTGDLYPFNLFTALQDMFDNAGDDNAKRVFQKAFSAPENLSKIIINEKQLLCLQNQAVQTYMYGLENTTGTFESPPTEVSKLIDRYHCLVPDRNKKASELFINITKHILWAEGIHKKTDVPIQPSAMVKIVQKLPVHPDLRVILEKIDICPPRILDFCQNSVGHLYNLEQNSITEQCVLENEKFNLSFAGFMLPSFMQAVVVVCKNETEAQIYEEHDAIEKYKRLRLEKLKVRIETQGLQNICTNLMYGHNVMSGINLSEFRLSGVVEYRRYFATTTNTANISTKFVECLKKLGKYKEKNRFAWLNVLGSGCHVVDSLYLGGYVEITARPQHSSNFNPKNMTDVVDIFKFLQTNIGTTQSYTNHLKTRNWKFTLTYHGGDGNLARPGINRIFSKGGAEAFLKWKESLQFFPSALTSDVKLKNISEFIMNTDVDLGYLVSEGLHTIYQFEQCVKPVLTRKELSKCYIL